MNKRKPGSSKRRNAAQNLRRRMAAIRAHFYTLGSRVGNRPKQREYVVVGHVHVVFTDNMKSFQGRPFDSSTRRVSPIYPAATVTPECPAV